MSRANQAAAKLLKGVPGLQVHEADELVAEATYAPKNPEYDPLRPKRLKKADRALLDEFLAAHETTQSAPTT